jgi:DNA repair protein RadC
MHIATASDAARLLSPALEGAGGEALVVAYLDADRRLLHIERSEGSAWSVELPTRAIAAEALRLGAAGLIVAHNHPGGDPRPSAADLDATRRLAELADSLGMRLHDHLIFARGTCRSLRALGLL